MVRLLLLVLVLMTASACQSGGDDAAPAIEAYWQARVEGDETRLAQLTCAAREAQVPMEAQSFASVDASIQSIDCTQSGGNGDTVVVTCTGAIVATYAGENREFPFGTYTAVREGGEWKYCGETE